MRGLVSGHGIKNEVHYFCSVLVWVHGFWVEGTLQPDFPEFQRPRWLSVRLRWTPYNGNGWHQAQHTQSPLLHKLVQN